uniref:Putative secreted protein n=1 Tax=Anopheles darlingi TaxID=43151 RepID=A0A2M4DN88_ANODA
MSCRRWKRVHWRHRAGLAVLPSCPVVASLLPYPYHHQVPSRPISYTQRSADPHRSLAPDRFHPGCAFGTLPVRTTSWPAATVCPFCYDYPDRLSGDCGLHRPMDRRDLHLPRSSVRLHRLS